MLCLWRQRLEDPGREGGGLQGRAELELRLAPHLLLQPSSKDQLQQTSPLFNVTPQQCLCNVSELNEREPRDTQGLNLNTAPQQVELQQVQLSPSLMVASVSQRWGKVQLWNPDTPPILRQERAAWHTSAWKAGQAMCWG